MCFVVLKAASRISSFVCVLSHVPCRLLFTFAIKHVIMLLLLLLLLVVVVVVVVVADQKRTMDTGSVARGTGRVKVMWSVSYDRTVLNETINRTS